MLKFRANLAFCLQKKREICVKTHKMLKFKRNLASYLQKGFICVKCLC